MALPLENFFPPYIVYKTSNCYESWCQGGPEGEIYAATKYGWFDMFVFEEWFSKTFLDINREKNAYIFLAFKCLYISSLLIVSSKNWQPNHVLESYSGIQEKSQ